MQITEAKPSYTGISFIESRISLDSPVYEKLSKEAGPGTYTCMAGEKSLIFQRQGDGSYRLYCGLAVPEDFERSAAIDLSNTAATRELFLSPEYFGVFNQDHKDYIAHSSNFWCWPLHSMSPGSLNWQPVKGLTLVGDAAHGGGPFTGEGVNCAMADAVVLANKIAGHGVGALDKAHSEYEEDMFKRGDKLINEAHKNKGVMFHKECPQYFVDCLLSGNF